MAVLPQRHDWTYYRGDTSTRTVVYDRPESPITDLTGWQVCAQVRSKIDGEIWLEKTQDDDITLSVDTGMLVCKILLLRPADTQEWTARRSAGVWDLQTTDPTGVVRTLIYGDFLFGDGDVTKVFS